MQPLIGGLMYTMAKCHDKNHLWYCKLATYVVRVGSNDHQNAEH